MRVHNFSAGPSILPEQVLRKASAEMLCYEDTGMSVMEMSHRSPAYMAIQEKAKSRLIHLLEIPDSHEVLFLQGGASTQFAAVPLNLMSQHKHGVYVDTGAWSQKAIKEAKKYGQVTVLASSASDGYTTIPQLDLSGVTKADYLHITSNNTIYGTAFEALPDSGDLPLVVDMSSDILSKPIDVSKTALIYAGAQKNAGAAGLTLVIIRKDLLGKALPETPIMLNYQTHASKDSLYNTPPTFAIYIAGLVYEWIEDMGGLDGMARLNQEKANRLYNHIDQSKLFQANIALPYRSTMNVCFKLRDEELTGSFLKRAADAGLKNLKGHRSVGGLRASLYNALSLESVEALISFMEEFEAQAMSN